MSENPAWLDCRLDTELIKALGFTVPRFLTLWKALSRFHHPGQLFADVEFSGSGKIELGSLERLMAEPDFDERFLLCYQLGPATLAFVRGFVPAYRQFLDRIDRRKA